MVFRLSMIADLDRDLRFRAASRPVSRDGHTFALADQLSFSLTGSDLDVRAVTV